MNEAAVAFSLLDDIAVSARPRGGNGKSKIGLIFDILSERYPREDDDPSVWTWRRVKALWHEEVPPWAVRARELRELNETLHALRDARERHARYKEETDRIRAHFLGLATTLEAGDADFHRADVEGLRSVASRVDRPGNSGGE